MGDLIKFPEKPEAPISVTLTGAEWFAIGLKLAGRAYGNYQAQAEAAEAKLLAQLNRGK